MAESNSAAKRGWLAYVASVQVPPRLADKGRDSRGYVVTYTTGFDIDGNPKFLSSETGRRLFCWRQRLCGVCGEKLEGTIVNILNEEQVAQGDFDCEEPFMHEECARYAAATCPFIARPNYDYIKSTTPPEGYTKEEWNSNRVKNRPTKMVFFFTDGYSPVRLQKGVRVYVVGNKPSKVEPTPEVNLNDPADL